jgi:hypothetical protein
MHCGMVFGYDLLSDLLEMLNFNKYRSTVATRRNLVDPIQLRNMSDLISKRLEHSAYPMEGYMFESQLETFPFNFFHFVIFV